MKIMGKESKQGLKVVAEQYSVVLRAPLHCSGVGW